MSFAIVVDSVADLSEEECAHYDIVSVPLTVEVGTESFKDQVEISSEQFYDKMIASETLPKSSQPAPSEFIEVFNDLAAKGNDQVIAIHLAAVLSGTSESSNLAANQVEVPVEVIDSFNACSGQALLALLAAQLRDEGVSAEDAIETLKKARAHTHFFIGCSTLDNLLAGGRLSPEEVDTATLLDIKPVLTFDETGVLKAVDKVKGMNGIIKKYVEKLQELTDAEGIQRVRFAHARNPKYIEKLKRAIEDAGIEYIDCGTCSCGAIVTTHLGMGALGMGTMPDSSASVIA